jgi:pimeloyl-ACP methyl ester carboxylesterase
MSSAQRIRSNDAELEYYVQGSGPPVVLLHPFPAHHGVWTAVADVLSTRYRCILPDLRGHGKSQPGIGPATMAKHAADLERICREEEIGKAVFAGSSIGGYILFEFWRQHRERVAGLVLCNTRAQADSPAARAARLQAAADVEQHGPAQFVASSIERLVGETTRRNRPDLTEAAAAMMREMLVAGIVAVQQGMAERPDSVATLASIDVPTLIIAGDEDVISTAEDSELMRREIRGSRMEIVRAAGHYAVFEQPAEVALLMRQFLEPLRW